MGEIKQTNFRLDENTVKVFRQFCEENGLNQAQGFDHIMQIVELDRAKAVTPDRLTEIEDFERSVKSIMAAYLTSIEINSNAEARIREQFSSALDRKDKLISDLQAQNELLRAEKEASEIARNEARKAQAAAEKGEKNAVEQLQIAKRMATEQENYKNMIAVQLAETNEKLSGYDSLRESEILLKNKTAELEGKIANLTQKAENEIKSQQARAELEKERAVMAKEREMRDQIRQTDRENAKLEARIEQLQEEVERLRKELSRQEEAE